MALVRIGHNVIAAVVFLLIAFTLNTDSAYASHTLDSQEQPADITTNCTGFGGFVPLECFQGSRKLTGAYNTDDLGPFMNKVFVGAISLGAILAVLRLAWAGFVYLSSDLWTSKDKAKEIIQETLLGLFLLLGIWLILYQINPDILKLKVGFESSGSATGNYPNDPGGLSPFSPTSPTKSTRSPPSSGATQQQPPPIQPKPPVVVPPSPPNQFCFVVEATGEQICKNTYAECNSSRTAHPSSTLTPCK
ncbi:hypothetical protein HY417_02795 [Candidatus Kaiserbacteria bacterium]|nr:hypothetical protein [Candidatus Kaiserbacteria bacterium]